MINITINLAASYVAIPGDLNIVRLNWTTVATAVSYNIYRNDIKINDSPVTSTTYDDKATATFTFSYYYIRPVNLLGVEFAQSETIMNVEPIAKDLVDRLRSNLKDANKARWDDTELLIILDKALWYINGIPVFSNWSHETIPQSFTGYLLGMGQAIAMMDQGGKEITKEFSANDNGIAITIERSNKYLSFANSLWEKFDGALRKSKLNLVMTLAPAGIVENQFSFKIRTYSPSQWRIR